MMAPIPYVHYGIGILTVFLAVPLVLRKIPMNRVYGIRIQEAFVSKANWYEINAYGGKLFLVFGLFVLAFGVLGQYFAPPPNSPWAPLYLVVPLAPIIPVLALVKAFARRLPNSQE